MSRGHDDEGIILLMLPFPIFVMLFLRVLCVLRGERVEGDNYEWIMSKSIFTATARSA
jgi:hypothetical protein